ncbi:MAG: mandelate racemase/muconate lactonizing enzyme family protein [Deltaproteobacteria bacterium]|nr:mandelate racemase/muconate lactonizing enzyme family protein [Deltaproteobacteria bacterium]
MRITEIHVYRRDLPVMGGSFCIAGKALSSLDTTVVRIATDAGLSGFGETCPVGPVYQPQHALGARAALQEMGPCLIGLNPLHLDPAREAMEASLNGARYAKAAVDIALWDLLGKALGVRVCDLLGGPRRERVPSYYSIGVLPPDEAVRTAREKEAEGFKRIQLKVGGRNLQEDMEAVRRVSEALSPGVSLVVDANRAWTSRDARLVSLQCRDLPLVLEQPCSTYEENRALRPGLAHPLFLDESAEDIRTVLRCIGEDAADGFGLKVTRVGGLTPMRTIRDICREAGLPATCDDAWGGDIIAAACIHLAATMRPSLLEGVWIAAPYIETHYDPENGPEIRDGFLELPKGHGLGVSPDLALFGAPVMSFG